jgi:hypothetical membrane protein
MNNPGKKIFLIGACILIIYGIFLGAIGLYEESGNLSLTWWFARLTLFVTIFSATLFLGLYFLKQEK